MNPRWRRHAARNRLQSLLLLGFMAAFLVLLGRLLWGPQAVWQLLIAGAIVVLLTPVASPWLVLRLYRARPLAPDEAPLLFRALDELARRAELERVPALYYVPSGMTNAFTVGTRRNAAIAVTDGLLTRLAPREIVAVLAHEVSHIRSNDTWLMGLADAMSRLTHVLSLFGQVLLLINLPLLVMGQVQLNWLAIALLVFAPHLSLLAQAGLSHTREYDADFNGALLTGDPEALAGALAKIERHQRSLMRLLLPGFRLPEPSWLRTHPPTEERIRRLLTLRDELARESFGEEVAGEGWASRLAPGAPRYRASGLWY